MSDYTKLEAALSGAANVIEVPRYETETREVKNGIGVVTSRQVEEHKLIVTMSPMDLFEYIFKFDEHGKLTSIGHIGPRY